MRSKKLSKKGIQNILDNCLERMLQGESIEDCLTTYPEQARELEPLLEICSAIRQSSLVIRPAFEFKERVRSQLQGMLVAKAEPKRAKVPIWHRRWVVALASVLVIFIAGIGTVVASLNTLPGESLYRVKLASEEIRLTLSFSDLNKAKLYIQFAQRRTAEMAETARQGNGDKTFLLAEKAASNVEQLGRILEEAKTRQANGPKLLAPSPPPTPFTSEETEAYGEIAKGDKGELATMLSHSRTRNLDKLQAALDKAPEELKPYLEQAIKNIARNYDRTISIIES
ncbi:MAG: hypothetical protein CO103_00905 [Chloroflexi bacterium CG_4_9_14_3_um_filter_45_9]|nr:MAG: hypothetical protein COT13_03345 [Chloroflexi bacterium CG08_land_8_20_14_0_20_45_12]PIX27791.1 MAG: hypothetical protein COZ67_00355 [Chloroflexi bacterium CG_4_8_14_3_um_filter_45_15]PJB51013.1 MAG: hypothetical protein CO103_00905 [Chloroflexi bacterium CG_4_9_14_3_um_filter_45_9]